MSVSLEVGPRFFEIGSSKFLHSFFSTVGYHLEKDGWGTRFPALMNELYLGKLPSNRVKEASRELACVAEELSRFQPKEAIWDIENLDARPPWGDNISSDVHTLADYFGTSDGEDLIEVMQRALKFSQEKGYDVTIATV